MVAFHRSAIQWRHNERDDVSNHQPHDCLLSLYLGADQRNYQSFASLAFVWGIGRWPVNSPHKGSVTRKRFPFDDVIMDWDSLPFVLFMSIYSWMLRQCNEIRTRFAPCCGLLWFDTGQLYPLPIYMHVGIFSHYCDVIMGAMASQITSLTIVYSTVYSGTDQRKHQSWPVNSPHKWPVTRKCFHLMTSSWRAAKPSYDCPLPKQ